MSNRKEDEFLYRELCELPTFPFHALTRPSKESVTRSRLAFFDTRKLPRFAYPRARRYPVDDYLQHVDGFLKVILTSKVRARVQELYVAKARELRLRAEIVQAICAGDDEGVSTKTLELFGPIANTRGELEAEFGEMISGGTPLYRHEKRINAEMMHGMVESALQHYGITNVDIRPTGRSGMRVAQIPGAGMRVKIPRDILISRARAVRLIAHEIEVHALRAHNGANSPLMILARGLDGYLATEEGLAIWHQNSMSGKARRFDPGFWEAYANVLAGEMSFVEVFDVLSQARALLADHVGNEDPVEAGRDAAWRLCLRVYRGISKFDTAGVGFYRDHVYRSGLMMVRNVIHDGYKENIRPLFSGKLGVNHLDKLSDIELGHVRVPEGIGREIVDSAML